MHGPVPNCCIMTPFDFPARRETVNFIRSGCSKRFVARFCIGLLIALYAGVVAAQPADKKETLNHARQSYYSLKDQGLAEFQCAIAPDWRLLLTEQKLASDAVERGVVLLE